jgi:hypothetical protein
MGQLRSSVASGSLGNNEGSRRILNELNRLFPSKPLPSFLDSNFTITTLTPSRTNFLEFSAGEIEINNAFTLAMTVNHLQNGKTTSVSFTLE